MRGFEQRRLDAKREKAFAWWKTWGRVWNLIGTGHALKNNLVVMVEHEDVAKRRAAAHEVATAIVASAAVGGLL